MQVSVARRVERRAGELGAWILLGLGTGIAAGFLLSEVFGTGGHRRMGRLLGRGRRTKVQATPRAVLLARVLAALQADPLLAAEPLEVRPRGRGLELRGWVATRAARALAYRLAREAAGTGEITNHLLVRGEDDRVETQDAPRSA
ncbi:MAG TPA: BON domain-containing protein [Gemmatimonadales bacterium]|jgi:hypothetical protein|nr:BON domain-containing protein [Gemmatimonadales bacterium]